MSEVRSEPYVVLAVLRWRWWLIEAHMQGRLLLPLRMWTFP